MPLPYIDPPLKEMERGFDQLGYDPNLAEALSVTAKKSIRHCLVRLEGVSCALAAFDAEHLGNHSLGRGLSSIQEDLRNDFLENALSI